MIERLRCDDYIVVGEAWVGLVSDIISLTTDGNYTKVSTVDGKFTIRKKSNECEARLPEKMFCRANRGCVFNLGQVKIIKRYDSKRLALVLEDGQEVVMSRLQTIDFKRSKSL